MENLLVVVGLFNFYNIVSNDVIIEKKHDILTKKKFVDIFGVHKKKI